MTPPGPKAARTKQRIIIAAAEAVNESTFENVSLSQVALRAGVTVGAFYFHFRSKEEVAHAVIAAQNAYSQNKAVATLQSGFPLLETMLRVSADFTYDILQDPVVRAGTRLTSQVVAFKNPPVGPFDGWIMFNEMLLNGELDERLIHAETDVRRTAEFIVGSYTGHYIFSTLLNDLPGLPVRVFTLWELFIRTFVLNDQDVWVARARELFQGRPIPKVLSLDEATDVHLGVT